VSGDKDIDFKIQKLSETEFEVTQLPDGKPQKINVKDIDLEYNSLLRCKVDGKDKILQFINSKDSYNFNFYLKGNTLHTTIYDENQYKYRQFMPEPKKINFAKSVISPMPGSIVSVNVEAGQTVAEGQDLITIEAMKM
jgi:biotin carboxyl carrier protein